MWFVFPFVRIEFKEVVQIPLKCFSPAFLLPILRPCVKNLRAALAIEGTAEVFVVYSPVGSKVNLFYDCGYKFVIIPVLLYQLDSSKP